MKIVFYTVMLWATAAFSMGFAESLVALQVIAYGDEIFDPLSGTTDLPQGGEVIDQELLVRLKAGEIRYQEGAFVEARSAVVEGNFGHIVASQVSLDLTHKTLSAQGIVQFNSNSLDVDTESIYIYVDSGLAILQGSTESQQPLFTTEHVVIDTDSQVAVMEAPFYYEDDFLVLSNGTPGNFLQLTWFYDPELSQELEFQASTNVEPSVYNRLHSYLSQ